MWNSGMMPRARSAGSSASVRGTASADAKIPLRPAGRASGAPWCRRYGANSATSAGSGSCRRRGFGPAAAIRCPHGRPKSDRQEPVDLGHELDDGDASACAAASRRAIGSA